MAPETPDGPGADATAGLQLIEEDHQGGAPPDDPGEDVGLDVSLEGAAKIRIERYEGQRDGRDTEEFLNAHRASVRFPRCFGDGAATVARSSTIDSRSRPYSIRRAHAFTRAAYAASR